MKVAFLTHYYAPERGAPQTRLRETIAGLRRIGIEATVITCAPHYPEGRVIDGRPAWRARTDFLDGVAVHRLPMIPRPNRGIVDRLIDQGSFAAAAVFAAPVIRSCDVFVVESPPLFLGATAALLRSLTGRRYLFHVADPWPDFPIAAGVLRGRIPVRIALGLEELAYRRASLITTVTPPLVERLTRKPDAAGKVRLLLNTVEVDRFQPARSRQDARAALGWAEVPTIVYSGTVGLAQGLGTLVDAVRAVEADGRLVGADYRIHVVGDGVEAAALRGQAEADGLTRIQFHPSMSADRVSTLLAAADGILVMLRRGPLYDESLPTKLVEGLAAGRPIIVSADGYPARLVDDAAAGISSPAEDAPALARSIERIVTDPAVRAMGAAGRALAERQFRRDDAVRILADLLAEVAARR